MSEAELETRTICQCGHPVSVHTKPWSSTARCHNSWAGRGQCTCANLEPVLVTSNSKLYRCIGDDALDKGLARSIAAGFETHFLTTSVSTEESTL